MLARFAAFEFRYQLFSPGFVVLGLIFFLITFASVTSPFIQIGAGGAVNINSPFAISLTILILSIFGIFIPAVYLGSVVLRDRHFGTEGLFFSTPVTKLDYLGGRFVGAFAIVLLTFAAAPLAQIVGVFMPWLDPELVGPFNFGHYVYAYVVFAIPNMAIVGAIMFTVANLTRSNMLMFTAALVVIVLYFIANALTNEPELRTIAAILDPLGVNAFGEAVRYWAPFELNSKVAPLEGLLLINRILWLAVAVALFAANYAWFSFKSRGVSALRRGKAEAGEGGAQTVVVELPTSRPSHGFGVALQQLGVRTRYEVGIILKSVTFWLVLGIGIFLSVLGGLLTGQIYGRPVLPATQIMIEVVQGQFSIVPVVVLIYFASELVWRDRVHRAHELIDATPTPSWVFFFSKIFAMWATLFALFAVSVLTAIALQAAKGFFEIDLGVYLTRMMGQDAYAAYLIAALAVFIQVVANNRFVGMAVMVGYLIATMVLSLLGFQHNLYLFASGPDAPYSGMNGSGHFVIGLDWFYLYWTFCAAILMVLSFLLWNRGALTPIRRRIFALPSRVTPAVGAALAVFAAGFVATGAYIFYNTNVLNTYMTTRDVEKRAVAYEEKYRPFEDLPQPRVTDVQVDVDLYPYERRYDARGTYVIENKTDAPIDQVHVGYGFGTEVVSQSLEGATLTEPDEAFAHYVWTLDRPMAPGERRTLGFTVARSNPGFRNQDNSSSVVWNGTFVNNFESMPWIGFNPGQMLQDRATRRRYDLEPIDRLPALEDDAAAHTNYLRGDSDWVTFDTTVSTAPDQIVVAPGYLQREWEENGRRYFHYKMDVPILNFFSYLSARYAVAEDESNGVKLQVFYHPEHAYNVERMIDGMKDTLAYASEAFSPFQHHQMRIFEFPSFIGTFAQSFPNSVPFSEGIGFLADNRDPDQIDYVYYVTAHEVGHQWWAHQVMGGNNQGATLLSETFAQYTAIMLMEHAYGEDHIRRFLKYELDNYLSSRGSEQVEELPLYRVENQPYIHYRKGAVVMYALKDYLGEETVNRVLARLIEETAYESDPYPRSTDFLRILREEAGPEHETLIEDLFEKIVLFDLKVEDVDVSARPDGRYDVRMTVEARKLEADGQGAETEVPLDYRIDVGLFSEHPDDVTEGSDHVILIEKRRVTSGETVLEFVVDEAPAVVGIDPYNKLIDRNSDDNLRRAGGAARAAEAAPDAAAEAAGSR